MEQKVYMINGVEYTLKDLTLDEADEVNKIIVLCGGTVALNNKQTKRFLEIVLRPISPDAGAPSDFGKCTENIALEVCKDFFSAKLASAQSLKRYFDDLAQNQN